MLKFKIVLINFIFLVQQLSFCRVSLANNASNENLEKNDFNARYESIKREIDERVKKVGGKLMDNDIERLVLSDNQYGSARHLLSDLFTCSANLIESGYGVNIGVYDTVVQGALFLQLALEVRKNWDLEKLHQENSKINSSFVPQEAIVHLYGAKESCENYLRSIKENGLKPSRFPNTGVLNEMIREMRNKHQMDEGIIDLVIYALDYFRRDSYPNDYESEERTKRIKDPFSGKAICVRPKIHNLGVPFFKLYKLSLRCITPLGRLVDYQSPYQFKIVGSFIYQLGESTVTDQQRIPLTIDLLSDKFKDHYYIEEKVSVGFAEVSFKSQTGDVRVNNITIENEEERRRGAMLDQLKERSRQSGGLYLGFGTHKLTGKLKEKKSTYAPMESQYASYVREKGNIPKQLGFYEFWWSSPDGALDEEFLNKIEVEEKRKSTKGTKDKSPNGNTVKSEKSNFMGRFPFENEVINPHFWQDQAKKERKHATQKKRGSKYRLARTAAKGKDEDVADLIAGDPGVYIHAIEGKYINLLTPRVSALILIYMSKNLSPTTNIPYSHYIARFVQKYVRHLAHRNPKRITYYFELLLSEMGNAAKDEPPTPKQAGVLIGGIIAGTIQHVYAIKVSDERRTLIVNSLTNLIWAGTTFIGVIPFLIGNAAALVAGGISFFVVTADTIWQFAETPRDYTSMIKELEGRIKMNALQIGESHIEEKESVTTMLEWMDATILVNGQPD